MATHMMRRRYLVALAALALLVALLLGGRAGWRLVHRLAGPPPPPRQADISAIAGWMSVPYVGRAYRVPPSELYGALGVAQEGHRTSTLDDIARETGQTPNEVIEIARATVRAWQQPRRPPPKPEAPKPTG